LEGAGQTDQGIKPEIARFIISSEKTISVFRELLSGNFVIKKVSGIQIKLIRIEK